MKEKFDCKLLYSDTDSFLHQIFTDDLFGTIAQSQELRSLFDFSNFSKNHLLFDDSRKRVTLLMKDEFGGEVLEEFVGLKPKLYSVTTASGKALAFHTTECSNYMLYISGAHKQSAKGITKHAQRSLQHQKYKEVLSRKNIVRSINTRIHSKNHNIHTIRVNKVSLSCFDDKRFIFGNGITTLPYGHHLLRESVFERKIEKDLEWGDTLWEEEIESEIESVIETVEGGGFVPTFSPPDPGFNQREYSESELESNGLDSDSTYPYSESPPRCEYILDEAVESDSETPPPRKRRKRIIYISDWE